jgi:chemosensory pili system protein ChpA (sensor histidine kinase/response regulator)
MIEVPAAATAAAAEPHSVYDTRQAQAIEHAASEPPATIDFDPEIAAIFAEEAAELLEDAERSLQAIRQAQGTNGVTELQRVLHTLKGGARMAGVLPMGDLSHGLETLLARVSAASATPDAAALDLVQRTLDRLQQMRDSIDAGRMASAPADLLAELEAHGTERVSDAAGDMEEPIAAHESAEAPHVEVPAASAADREPETGGVVPAEADLAAPTFEPQSTPLATSAADADQDLAVSPQESALDATSFELEIAAGAAQVPEPTAAAPEAAEVDADTASEQVLPEPTIVEALQPLELASPLADGAPPGEPETALPRTAPEEAPAAAAPPDRRGPERAETARVDAALLDALLNGAGEINIFQSRLNQQLHSIDFHLGELGSTVARLREQLRKLEAETEAQILFRHQEDLEAGGGFDPLELDRYSTIQQLSRALAESANDVASINELLNGLTNETGTLLTQQARVTAELQNGLMRTRMVPFERHVSRLARIVRQACADTGKAAELVVEGENSLIDRQVLESMLPPFEHLLRNAVAHGIEPPQVRQQRGKPPVGKVFLKLKREGGEVLVEVTDDGGGLDLTAIRRKAVDKGLIAEQQRISDEQAVELILRPGFSTAGELTQAAGRGVGMDVVDTEIKKLGGSMRIESTPGQGARFLIRLPYTLAITHALIVNVGDETFALPLPTVEGITRLSREKILKHLTDDEPRLNHGGVAYRIQHLGSLVGAAPSALPEDENAVSLVLIRAGESSTALLTDSLEGSREIVVKTLGPHIASVPGVTGATILGDGRVIMILDPGTLVRSQKGAEPAVPPPAQHTARPLAALVVDDSITMRRVTQRLLERRGVKVLTARDGLDAITVLQDNEVDVVLLDIEMPRMDGYQFATHVRNDAQLKNLPIIMITSRSGEKHRAKAIEIGVNDYLSKPYQESQLVAAIEALLGRHL